MTGEVEGMVSVGGIVSGDECAYEWGGWSSCVVWYGICHGLIMDIPHSSSNALLLPSFHLSPSPKLLNSNANHKTSSPSSTYQSDAPSPPQSALLSGTPPSHTESRNAYSLFETPLLV